MADTNLKLVGLDFNSLKSNLKEYLKRSESPFKDVDFEGSNINQLLDVLSYNTYINSYYLNMVASEMFLDTATLKDSVISHAKELNYTPRSYRSSQAEISFSITPSSTLDTLLIPKGTTFTTKVGSNNYTFSTKENIVLLANTSGAFTANNINIYEGVYVTDVFVFSSNTQTRYVLSNPTIDIESLSVVVSENDGSNNYIYQKAASFLDSSANSQIYFLQAAENEQYELLFGDNIVGRKPLNGSSIIVEYRVCSGEQPNGASFFSIDSSIQGQSNISAIAVNKKAFGGSVNESIESIKFNAPRFYQNQNRAVTATDYENILKQNFSEIQNISAYGGEDANPPQYGRVIIAVDLYNTDGLSSLDKERFKNFIKARSTVGLEPIFVDPEFLYLEVVTEVRFNKSTSNLTSDAITALVRNAISQYNSENLDGFKKVARVAKLSEKIMQAHPSILGIDLRIKPYYKLVPDLNTTFNKTIGFNFKLTQFFSHASKSENYIRSKIKAVYSSKFTFLNKTCTIQDDYNGKLSIYETEQDIDGTFLKDIGTVDYDKGILQINGLTVEDFEGDGIHIHVTPEDSDVAAFNNAIITIKDADVDITSTPIDV